MKKLSNIFKWNNWVVFIFLSITWGTSFILIKKSLVAFDSYQAASLRILMTTIIFTPIVITKYKELNLKKWYQYLIVGLAGGGFPPFLFAIAQTKLSSGLSGVLNALTPIFTLLFAIFLFQTKVDFRKYLGVGIGFIGAGLIFYNTSSNLEGGILYSSIIVLATMCYAFNSNFVKKVFHDHDPVLLTGASFVSFGYLTVFILLGGDFVEVLTTDEQALYSLGASAMLAIFSTVIATALFYKLIQKSSAVFASSVSYVIPFIALILGNLDGESFGIMELLSLIFIILGVYLTRD